MSENSSANKDTRNDEIDLLDLFRRMGRTLSIWGNALGRAFLVSVVFLIKRWLPLGLSIILGVGASYFLKMTSDSTFSSDLVLRTNATTTAEMISYLNRLHTFCVERNKSALAGALSLKDQQVDNIGDISAFWIIDNGRDGVPDYVDYKDNHNVYDTVNVRMMDRLDIRVKIKAPQELTNMRDGIIKFINDEQLFQQRNVVRLRQNKEMLVRLDYDILQLDSLQKFKYFQETRNMQPKNGGQMIFLQEQKTQLIYGDIYSLYTRKQSLESERDLYSEIVTVLSEFSIPAKRFNGGMYYAKRVVPLFFSVALLILILLANKKKIQEVYQKY
jgi:hypothetical protein